MAEQKREFVDFLRFLAALHSHVLPLSDRVCAFCKERFDKVVIKSAAKNFSFFKLKGVVANVCLLNVITFLSRQQTGAIAYAQNHKI